LRVFIGRFWGFRPERVPFITFSRAIHRNALLRASEEGDRIVIVGTKREDPAPGDRGHLLGMAEIGRNAVDTLDVIKPADIPAREWAGAEPRCPKAIPMLQAWRFTGAPDVPALLNWKLPRAVAGAAECLRTSAAALVLSLPHEPVTLRDSLKSTVRRAEAPRSAAAPGAPHGEGLFFLYRFGRRNAFKFGNSFEERRSLAELNRHIPGVLTEESWEMVRSERVASLRDAQALEQRFANALAAHHVAGDLFVCDARTMEAAWTRLTTRGQQGTGNREQ
jgi:hypothetical protein